MAVRAQLETVSVVDAAAKRLRDDLLSGRYSAGQELKDTQVALEFGIARPTARMAIQHLVNQGMLVRPPGYSARVRAFTPAEVADLYRVRRLVELEAVTEIKSRSLPLGGAEAALERFAALPPDAGWFDIAAADVAFHSAVVDAASSPRLREFYASISDELLLLIAHLRTHYGSVESLHREHRALYEQLRDAPIETVTATWSAHLDDARGFLETHLTA